MAEEMSNHHSLAFSLAIATVIHQTLRQVEVCTRLSEVLLILSETHLFPYWQAWAKIMLGWCQTTRGNHGGIFNMSTGIEEYKVTGARMLLPYFYSIYAEALIQFERYKEAKDALDESNSTAISTKVSFYHSEYFRLMASLSSFTDIDMSSSLLLKQAEKIARSQNNKHLLAKLTPVR